MRLTLHGEIALSNTDASKALTTFTDWVKDLLPADKYSVFLSLLKFPIDTNRLTDEVYQALEKVFDGRDAVEDHEFLSDEDKYDFESYRKEKLSEPEIWKTVGYDKMKTSINSLLVVDLPVEQSTEMPEPYFYWLDIKNVVDYETTNGIIDWVIFNLREDRIAVYDDKYYRIFNTKDKMITEVVVDVSHDLGYCPVSWFWTDAISSKYPDYKKSPISAYLAQLDHILFYSISKRYADLYAPWSIYWGYAQDCEYEDSTTGQYCDSGYLKDQKDNYVLYPNGVSLMKCPKCAEKKITGVGSFIEVPPPSGENENVNLVPPVGIIPADVPTLDYNVKEVDRLEKSFYQSVTGNTFDTILNDQAVNKDQVLALFESRKQVLVTLKKNFEKAQHFVNSTIAKLRYGSSYVRSYVNYGNEFYLFSSEVLLAEYIKAKAAGADHSILDMLQDQYFDTQYRNNPMELQRQKILLDLDPFRHLTKIEVKELNTTGSIEHVDYMIKTNFSTYLKRFERENFSVLLFGQTLEYSKKIEAIYEVLKSYVKLPEIKLPEINKDGEQND